MARSREPFEDDGHTIAPMDVEGMPWYDRAHRPARRQSGGQGERLGFHAIAGILTAALAVAAVFALGFGAVLLVMSRV